MKLRAECLPYKLTPEMRQFVERRIKSVIVEQAISHSDSIFIALYVQGLLDGADVERSR